MASSTSQLIHGGANPAKKVTIYSNGDKHFSGKPFVINPRTTRNFDSFLNHVTVTLKPAFGAVRSIRTPDHGSEVTDLAHLESGQAYVAGGLGKFRKLGYKGIVAPSPTKQHGLSPREFGGARKNRLIVSGRIKKIRRETVAIFVYSNGDVREPAKRILLQPWIERTWDGIMRTVNDRVNLKTGAAIRRLWDMNMKQEVVDINQLSNNEFYVAVGSEKFKDMEYGSHLLLSPRVQQKKKPLQLPPIKRRSKASNNSSGGNSTGSTVNSDSTAGTKSSDDSKLPHNRAPRKIAPKKEGGIPIKPIKHKRSGETRKQVDLDEDLGGVYKAKDLRNDRAEEVGEDTHTKTEVPVDQREAEEVEEEIPQTQKQSKPNRKPKAKPVEEPPHRPENPPPIRKPLNTKRNLKQKPSEKPLEQEAPLPPIGTRQSIAAEQTTALAMAQVTSGASDDRDASPNHSPTPKSSPQPSPEPPRSASLRRTPSHVKSREATPIPDPIASTRSRSPSPFQKPVLETAASPNSSPPPSPKLSPPPSPNSNSSSKPRPTQASTPELNTIESERKSTPEESQAPEARREDTPVPASPARDSPTPTSPNRGSPKPDRSSPKPTTPVSDPSQPNVTESPKPANSEEPPKADSPVAGTSRPNSSPKPPNGSSDPNENDQEPTNSASPAEDDVKITTPPPASPAKSEKSTADGEENPKPATKSDDELDHPDELDRPASQPPQPSQPPSRSDGADIDDKKPEEKVPEEGNTKSGESSPAATEKEDKA